MGAACLIGAAWQLVAYSAAFAQQPLPLAAPPPAEAPAPTAMTAPTLAGPLVANPNPMKFDVGPLGARSFLKRFAKKPGGVNRRWIDLRVGVIVP